MSLDAGENMQSTCFECGSTLDILAAARFIYPLWVDLQLGPQFNSAASPVFPIEMDGGKIRPARLRCVSLLLELTEKHLNIHR